MNELDAAGVVLGVFDQGLLVLTSHRQWSSLLNSVHLTLAKRQQVENATLLLKQNNVMLYLCTEWHAWVGI